MTRPGYVPPPATGWWVKRNQIRFTDAAQLALTTYPVGALQHQYNSPTKASLVLTKKPVGVTQVAPIQYISSTSAEAASVTMPTHTTNDLLLILACREGSSTAPSLPGGWNNIDTGAASFFAFRIGYKIAASGSETSGTWTNAAGLTVGVYRNAVAIGATAHLGASGADTEPFVSFPGITLQNQDTTSAVVKIGAHSQVNGTMGTTTTNGYTRRNWLQGASMDMVLCDSNGSVAGSTVAADSIGSGYTDLDYVGCTVELRRT